MYDVSRRGGTAAVAASSHMKHGWMDKVDSVRTGEEIGEPFSAMSIFVLLDVRFLIVMIETTVFSYLRR